MPEWLTICPVCGSGKAVYHFRFLEGTPELEESSTGCPRCGYFFTFGLGRTLATVDGQTFQWDWSNDVACKEERQTYLDALALANKTWQVTLV